MSRAGVYDFLDFRKDYDTVEKKFMHEDLRLFGFDKRFVYLIRRIYNGTTASIVMSGGESSVLPEWSGISRDCPFTPLLNLLVVKVLGLVSKHITALRGLKTPGMYGQRNLLLAFLDDSTLFLEKDEQFPHASRLAKASGA